MLLAEKYPEIFSKNKGYFLISRSFVLKLYIFEALTNKKTAAHCWASSVNIVLSYLCVGPLPRIKIHFFLLKIFTDNLT